MLFSPQSIVKISAAAYQAIAVNISWQNTNIFSSFFVKSRNRQIHIPNVFRFVIPHIQFHFVDSYIRHQDDPVFFFDPYSFCSFLLILSIYKMYPCIFSFSTLKFRPSSKKWFHVTTIIIMFLTIYIPLCVGVIFCVNSIGLYPITTPRIRVLW